MGFSFAINLPASLWPWGVHSVSTRNEYQEYFLEVKDGRDLWLTNLPSSSADGLEILESEPSATSGPVTGLYSNYFTFTFTITCSIIYIANSKNLVLILKSNSLNVMLCISYANVQHTETLIFTSLHAIRYSLFLQFSSFGYGHIQGAALRRRI